MSPRRLITPGRTVTVFIIFVALALAVVLFSTSVDSPTLQVPLDMPGMDPHLVNVWLDPDPPRISATTITAQVVDAGGNPRAASSITFRIGRAEDEPLNEIAGVPVEASDRTSRARFRAALEFADPGSWWIDVTVKMGTTSAVVRLPIEVEG